MTRNLPTLKEIADNPGALRQLSLDALDALLSEAEAENKMISAAKRAINTYIEESYAGPIHQAYSVENKDFGTVHVRDGGFDIEVTTPKKVEWDQTKLAAIRAAIKDAGDNPTEYVKETLSVDERAFTAWPAYIRATFEAARTVKPGARTLKILRKEAA